MVSMYFLSNLKALFEDIGDRVAEGFRLRNMQRAVADFWQEIWTMNLLHFFVCDFEEYQNSDTGKQVIAIWFGDAAWNHISSSKRYTWFSVFVASSLAFFSISSSWRFIFG